MEEKYILTFIEIVYLIYMLYQKMSLKGISNIVIQTYILAQFQLYRNVKVVLMRIVSLEHF